MPNFHTLENAGNIPLLTPGQKFRVVARGVFDPFEFVLIGFVAGLGQASNSNPSYGQGAQGYAKRYGTSYADNAVENFMASAVFPTILHQDLRYTSSVMERLPEALCSRREPSYHHAC